MSSRRPEPPTFSIDAQRLRHELESLKQQSAAVEAAGAAAQQGLPSQSSRAMEAPGGQISFDQLSVVEQAAGSLGVHPEAWKPITFMNDAHYDTLLKSNSLDHDLITRIEAFRHVAAQ